MITASVARAKDAILSFISWPKIGRSFHSKVLKNPVSIPAITPFLVVFFHFSVKSNAGPKEAPSPHQAKATVAKIRRFEIRAKMKAIIPTKIVMILDASNWVFSDIFRLKILWYISSDREDEITSS